MPVNLEYERLPSAKPAEAIDAHLMVRAHSRAMFQEQGLTTAMAFLNMPGEIVSGHPDRHVMRVQLADGRWAFLKREHRIRWKDRWRNLCDGFGRVSKSLREGTVLREIEARGLPVPRWLAFGEDDSGRAFLLVEEVAGTRDLRHAARDPRLPVLLARLCATLHQGDIDHPDLGAKHLLLAGDTLTVLDWQRASLRRQVPWSRRIRSMAQLLATLPRFTDADRRQFIAHYRDALLAGFATGVMSEHALFDACESQRRVLQKKRQVHDQCQPPLEPNAQRLVWLDGEALCAIPDAVGDLEPPAMRAMLHDPAAAGDFLQLRDGSVARLDVARHRAWAGRLLAFVRRKCWRAPELVKARLLFHLERYRVPTRRLFAYGQRCTALSATAFVLAEALPARTLTTALREADDDQRHLLFRQLFETIGRLHQAGCTAGTVDLFAVRITDGESELFVAHPERLGFHRHVAERSRKADLDRVVRSLSPDCVDLARPTGFEQPLEETA